MRGPDPDAMHGPDPDALLGRIHAPTRPVCRRGAPPRRVPYYTDAPLHRLCIAAVCVPIRALRISVCVPIRAAASTFGLAACSSAPVGSAGGPRAASAAAPRQRVARSCARGTRGRPRGTRGTGQAPCLALGLPPRINMLTYGGCPPALRGGRRGGRRGQEPPYNGGEGGLEARAEDAYTPSYSEGALYTKGPSARAGDARLAVVRATWIVSVPPCIRP